MGSSSAYLWCCFVVLVFAVVDRKKKKRKENSPDGRGGVSIVRLCLQTELVGPA